MEPRTFHLGLRAGLALLTGLILSCDGNTPKTEHAGTSHTESARESASSVSPALTDIPYPRRQKYAHNLKIVEKYDRMDNYTTVDLDEMNLGGGLKLRVYFLYTGKKFTPPDDVTFYFSESSEEWKYLTYHPLRLLLNETDPLDLGEVDHDGTVGAGYVLEHMIVRLPVRQLLAIIAAKKVEGRLGLTDFTLKQSQLEALRDLASRMAPVQE